MTNHGVIQGRSPSLITSEGVGEPVYKKYVAKAIVKVPGTGDVVVHDHAPHVSFGDDVVRNLVIIGAKNGERVLVEDLLRGISFTGILKLGRTRAYVRIPKALWPFYQRGEEVVALITPLGTR